jgi:hypothetical protein
MSRVFTTLECFTREPCAIRLREAWLRVLITVGYV